MTKCSFIIEAYLRGQNDSKGVKFPCAPHTHVHMHAHMHACKHIRTHTYAHTHTCMHTHQLSILVLMKLTYRLQVTCIYTQNITTDSINISCYSNQTFILMLLKHKWGAHVHHFPTALVDEEIVEELNVFRATSLRCAT